MPKRREIEIVDLEDLDEDHFTLAYGQDAEALTKIAKELTKELDLKIVYYQNSSYALVLIYRMSIYCGKK